jgi:hypothetical protein
MHHLPAATATRSGFRIALEIHVDTMSPDQTGSLTLATLAVKPQRFRRGRGPHGTALGHLDMLHHLARHVFEPARHVRLINLYDLWRYEAIFREEIDWREMAARRPDVIVALKLVSHVFNAAPAADHLFDAGAGPVPAGVGLGMVPLSEIATAGLGPVAALACLLSPPAWWLHGFYAIPPGSSLLTCRAIRHPATVARWLARRLVAAIVSAVPRRTTGDRHRDDCVADVKS